MTKERLRIDLWASIRPVIEAEMQRSNLTAQEIVNIALANYFGLSPKSKNIEPPLTTQNEQADINKVNFTEDDDYI